MFELILERLNKLAVLNDLVLIGSWAAYLYRVYFGKEYNFIPKTTDLDLLIPLPYKDKRQIDLAEEFKDLNFIVQFSNEGYIKLGHPELSLEFIVPEYGRGSDKPFVINNLGINAQPLRYVSLLLQDVIDISYRGIKVKVPHPAIFVLQKLLIIPYRKKESKKLKDIEIAKSVISFIDKFPDDKKYMRKIFNTLPVSWQKKIVKQLNIIKLSDVAKFLLK